MTKVTNINCFATIITDARGYTHEMNMGTLCNGNMAYVVQTCNTYGSCVASEIFDNLGEAVAWMNSIA